MGKLKWHKRWHNDSLHGMLGLSLEERGAYNTILDLIYANEDKLRDDDRLICGWLRCDPRIWRSIKRGLITLEKLVIENGYIRNPRATKEVTSALNQIQVKSDHARSQWDIKRRGQVSSSLRKPNGKAENQDANADVDADADAAGLHKRPRIENKDNDSLAVYPRKDEAGAVGPFVTAERMAGDLTSFGLKSNGRHSAHRPAFAPKSEMPPDQRLARFTQWLAPLVPGGWPTVVKAFDPDDDNHRVALNLCKRIAQEHGKGWPRLAPQ